MKIADNQIAKTKASLKDIAANSFGFYQKADKEKWKCGKSFKQLFNGYEVNIVIVKQ